MIAYPMVMQELQQYFSNPFGFGVEANDLSVIQVCVRGVIIFVSALVMVRLAHKRFLAKRTVFDVILSLILGSMLARAINGSEPLVPTLVAGFLLIALHHLLEYLAFWFPWVGGWVKGHTNLLVHNDALKEQNMVKHRITMDDLQEELRLQSNLESVTDVKYAFLERNGQVGIIKKPETLE